MQKKPTIAQLKKYLRKYNPLNLSGASFKLVSAHNHIHYRLKKNEKTYCLRMINPENYRHKEWITMDEEFAILKALESTHLSPKPYYVDLKKFDIPLIIQEFISPIKCFNRIEMPSKEQLQGVAKAIALLNTQDITPSNFPFLEKYTHYTYSSSFIKWQKRLFSIEQSNQKDVLNWIRKIEKITSKAKTILEKSESLLEETDYVFSFDAAHGGNTYWIKKENKVVFLDWQKVSYGDPSFTLARFLVAMGKKKGQEVSKVNKTIMLEAYLKQRNVPNFEKLLNARIFERQVSDLVWVLWHYVKSKKRKSVEKATSIVVRYEMIRKKLLT